MNKLLMYDEKIWQKKSATTTTDSCFVLFGTSKFGVVARNKPPARKPVVYSFSKLCQGISYTVFLQYSLVYIIIMILIILANHFNILKYSIIIIINIITFITIVINKVIIITIHKNHFIIIIVFSSIIISLRFFRFDTANETIHSTQFLHLYPAGLLKRKTETVESIRIVEVLLHRRNLLWLASATQPLMDWI